MKTYFELVEDQKYGDIQIMGPHAIHFNGTLIARLRPIEVEETKLSEVDQDLTVNQLIESGYRFILEPKK